MKKNQNQKRFWFFFSSKSWNWEELTKLRPETESRNRGDHELWNHKMRGSPVCNTEHSNLAKRDEKYILPTFPYYYFRTLLLPGLVTHPDWDELWLSLVSRSSQEIYLFLLGKHSYSSQKNFFLSSNTPKNQGNFFWLLHKSLKLND